MNVFDCRISNSIAGAEAGDIVVTANDICELRETGICGLQMYTVFENWPQYSQHAAWVQAVLSEPSGIHQDKLQDLFDGRPTKYSPEKRIVAIGNRDGVTDHIWDGYTWNRPEMGGD